MTSTKNLTMTPTSRVTYQSKTDQIVRRLGLMDMRVGQETEFPLALRREAALAVLRMRVKRPEWRFSIRARHSDGGLAWILRVA